MTVAKRPIATLHEGQSNLRPQGDQLDTRSHKTSPTLAIHPLNQNIYATQKQRHSNKSRAKGFGKIDRKMD